MCDSKSKNDLKPPLRKRKKV